MSVIAEHENLSEEINSIMEQNCMTKIEQENLTQYISYMLGITNPYDLQLAVLKHLYYYSEQGVYLEPSPMSLEALMEAQNTPDENLFGSKG